MTERNNIRQQETEDRRRKFRESLLADKELLKELTVGLQNAAPAAWEAMKK